MNVERMFELQAGFDQTVNSRKDITDQELNLKLRIALLVEIGELANEIRSFKFWSQDQDLRKEYALEELADCFHFLFSIGLLMDVDKDRAIRAADRVEQLFESTKDAKDATRTAMAEDFLKGLFVEGAKLFDAGQARQWSRVFTALCGLGLILGFTYDEMQVAFDAKNDKNHDRQKSGY